MLVSGVGSLTVSWMPPDQLNAPSINYTVLYSMVGSSTQFNVPVVGGDTMVEINGLSAFTEYSVMVQACSSAGCGPFTAPEIERTLEEGTCRGDLRKYMYMVYSVLPRPFQHSGPPLSPCLKQLYFFNVVTKMIDVVTNSTQTTPTC